jgi:hypothetical protein
MWYIPSCGHHPCASARHRAIHVSRHDDDPHPRDQGQQDCQHDHWGTVIPQGRFQDCARMFVRSRRIGHRLINIRRHLDSRFRDAAVATLPPPRTHRMTNGRVDQPRRPNLLTPDKVASNGAGFTSRLAPVSVGDSYIGTLDASDIVSRHAVAPSPLAYTSSSTACRVGSGDKPASTLPMPLLLTRVQTPLRCRPPEAPSRIPGDSAFPGSFLWWGGDILRPA